MKNLSDYQLIERFGYGMASYITAKVSHATHASMALLQIDSVSE
jgi:hypothetical protein